VCDLFGVKIRGRGSALASIRSSAGAEDSPAAGMEFPRTRGNTLPPVGPVHDAVDLADVDIRGAEVLVEVPETGDPLLVRHRMGDGEAYLLLAHDYPGNSWLAPFMTEFMHRLAAAVPSPVVLRDPSGEIYFTVRVDDETGVRRLHLVNTDWTEAGHVRHCTVELGGWSVPLAVREGAITELLWLDDCILHTDDGDLFIESLERTEDGFAAALHGHGEVCLSAALRTACPVRVVNWSGDSAAATPAGPGTEIRLSFDGCSNALLRIAPAE
jgi:hypothetical protein